MNEEAEASNNQSITGNTDSQQRVPPGGPKLTEFNLDQLRINQDFGAQLGVKKVITTIPVTKPGRQEWVRTHPDPAYQIETTVLEEAATNEIYLVNPELQHVLADEIKPARLFTAITRQGDLFLWRVKLPGVDGRNNPWNESSLLAAKKAETCWVRITSNANAGRYDVHEAAGQIPEPLWPGESFEEIIQIAFGERFISGLDHPVLRQLRGE